jgi:hypothetical protein
MSSAGDCPTDMVLRYIKRPRPRLRSTWKLQTSRISYVLGITILYESASTRQGSIQISFLAMTKCSECNGSGRVGGFVCTKCSGKGASRIAACSMQHITTAGLDQLGMAASGEVIPPVSLNYYSFCDRLSRRISWRCHTSKPIPPNVSSKPAMADSDQTVKRFGSAYHPTTSSGSIVYPHHPLWPQSELTHNSLKHTFTPLFVKQRNHACHVSPSAYHAHELAGLALRRGVRSPIKSIHTLTLVLFECKQIGVKNCSTFLCSSIV